MLKRPLPGLEHSASSAGGDVTSEGADAGSSEDEGDDDAEPGEPGEPGAAGTSADAKTGAPKKRRRRRRGKKGHGAGAPAVAGRRRNRPRGRPRKRATRARQPKGLKKSPSEKGGSAKGTPAKGKDKRKKPKGPRSESAPPRERTAFHIGEEVFGRVTSVTEHAIMVDLSGKALAIFDRHELRRRRPGARSGRPLRRARARRRFARRASSSSRASRCAKKKPSRVSRPRARAARPSLGLVTGTVKGGIEVDVDGLRAFAPGSHVDLRPGADLAHLIGRRLEFTVAQYAKRGRDVVVSRKNFIEVEAKEVRKSCARQARDRRDRQGSREERRAYGAFVAIPSADDVEGLVHMTEASHDRGAKLNRGLPRRRARSTSRSCASTTRASSGSRTRPPRSIPGKRP